jgi:putative exporter of polyketide antibiotics
LIPRALRETQPKSTGPISVSVNIVRGVITWIFLVGIVGLPYWIVLIPLHDLLLGDELRRQLVQSPASGSPSVSHFWKAFQSGL